MVKTATLLALTRIKKPATVMPTFVSPADLGTLASARAVGRPTSVEATQIRERVIHNARHVFLELGYDGASLDLIARAAGVHRDTLYRQYGSKESLFRAVLGSTMGRLRTGVVQAVGRGGSPNKILPRVARQVYADVRLPESLAMVRMIIAVGGRFPELAASAHDNWSADLAPFIDYLKAKCNSGVLQIDDPAEAAYAFTNAASVTVRALLEPPLDARALRAHIKRTVDVYLAGWQFRPGSPDAE
jgi:TetR/AcrR family transcriptional repressor of mexJK operon